MAATPDAAGDFPTIAKRELWEVGARLVRRVGIGAGEDVLDMACGTGNAPNRAAEAGGRVVGLDRTPEPFEAGRRLADEARSPWSGSRGTPRTCRSRTNVSTWRCPRSARCSRHATG